MGLNIQKGNMYGFVTHTWNAIKGKCEFDCSYCYMKRWGSLNPARLDEKELNTDLGSGNFIFVGSSIDMWHRNIPDEWIRKTLHHIARYPDNKYLFQSKDPSMFERILILMPEYFATDNMVFATTIETNRSMGDISKAPPPYHRAMNIGRMSMLGFETMVTVEPILDFDIDKFVSLLKSTMADQINIGAVTGGHKLPEPSKEKLDILIESIKPHLKNNIKRLI